MALTWFLLSSLVHMSVQAATTSESSIKPPHGLKRRNEVVDEAFLEQKDILLDMLESKLKEVRDKKKKKIDRTEANNVDGSKCESLPSNVDIKLKGNGLSALGETDLTLKFGNSGKGTLNLDANGISNVGKVRLELGVGDGSLYVPGLNNLFLGKSMLSNCNEKQNETETNNAKTQNFGNEVLDFRRSGNSNVTTDPDLGNNKTKEEVNEDTDDKDSIQIKLNSNGTNESSTTTADNVNALEVVSIGPDVHNSTIELRSTTKP